jgi:hypothetical protein
LFTSDICDEHLALMPGAARTLQLKRRQAAE